MNLEKDFAVVSKEEFDSFKGDYTTSKGFRKILSALSHYEEFMGLRGLSEEKTVELYMIETASFRMRCKILLAELLMTDVMLVNKLLDKLRPYEFAYNYKDHKTYNSLRNTIRNGEQWIVSSDSCMFINEWANKDMMKLRDTLKGFLES